MLVTAENQELRQAVRAARARGESIGCIPTMGALHAGHVSLMDAARSRCGFNVATIFVNPTQFAPHEDLAKYPRPIERDLAACNAAGIDVVFTPHIEAMYPPGFATWVEVTGLTSRLEGASRPTHFRGVTTIVMKLFQIVQPDAAFFGAKDYQQQLVIRRMVQDLNVPVEIVTCPTVREPDGLALSSRNVYLTPTQRAAALALSESLQLAEDLARSGARDVATIEAAMRSHLQAREGVEIDYAVIVDPDTLEPLASPRPRMTALVAARVGTTRLIDNRTITQEG